MESMTVSGWFVNWLTMGFSGATWWQIIAYTLVMTHITIASVTIFLHRAQAHLALDLHPWASHFFRFWLWLTTGMITREWVAIHRKHHAKCETTDDPHSPQTRGIWTVLLRGSELYRKEAKNQETIRRYGHKTPDDWIERAVYSRFIWQGVGLMLIINLLLFGVIGATVWAVQMLWIPVTAAGIINGLGHYAGYRNFKPSDSDNPDASTNISPWGIIIGGEELHNNHHTYPTSAKLSVKSWEFDIGWLYIRLLQAVGLARVKHQIPKLWVDTQATPCALESLLAIQRANPHVMAKFSQLLKQWRGLPEDAERLRCRLMVLWQSHEGKERLLELFRGWCREAERIPELRRFAWQLARSRLKS